MVSGFLACSAPLDPEECPLLFMTSEAWLWSAPHCKHFFLSVAPDLHSCCKLPAFLGFPSPAQPAVDSSSISQLYVLVCSLHLSSFSGQGLCSAPRANTSEGQQTDFIRAAQQLLLFWIIYDIPHELETEQFGSFTHSHT